MDFIIGGAYQGKLDYAVKRFSLSKDDIFTCSEDFGNPDFSFKCIDRIEEFTLWCVKHGADAVLEFDSHKDKWTDCVFICRDIFCGVVPLGKDMRDWRDSTGRLCAYLSANAASVTRVFCGLPQKLK